MRYLVQVRGWVKCATKKSSFALFNNTKTIRIVWKKSLKFRLIIITMFHESFNL